MIKRFVLVVQALLFSHRNNCLKPADCADFERSRILSEVKGTAISYFDNGRLDIDLIVLIVKFILMLSMFSTADCQSFQVVASN